MGVTLNKVHPGDCVETIRGIEPGSIDLAFADPPFNIGYEYDVYNDDRSALDYLDWSQQWMAGVFNSLKSEGTFWLAIGDEYAAELKMMAQKMGFNCRSWVIWYYTFGVNCKRGFSRSHTHLFHFTKDVRDFTFNEENPAVRIPSARQLVYADARANPKGRLPDNTWILRPQDVPDGFLDSQDTWYFPRVAGTFKERKGFHGCQMPEQLLGRIIRISSNPNDVVLDPFAGSGTTLAVAKKLGRQFLGIEISKDYVGCIRERLKATRVGDPLDGAKDPLKSAPKTKQGKAKAALRHSTNGKRRPSARMAMIRTEIKDAVVAAYKATNDGRSTDYVLADPDLNARFIERCHGFGVSGDPVIWNQVLLRERKNGRLPKLTKSRQKITFQQMDSFSFASEVALHLLSVEFGVTLDRILCDPELAAGFDQLAQRFAPGHSAFEYRWAALALRKRAKLSKRSACEYKSWLTQRLPRAQPIRKLKTTEYHTPGVYALIGGHARNLYVGETFDIGKRIAQVLDTDTWMELEPTAVRIFPQSEPGLHGLKSVLIQRLDSALNSRLLTPKIELLDEDNA